MVGILVAALPAFIVPARRGVARPARSELGGGGRHDPFRPTSRSATRGADGPTLDDVSLEIPEGELCVVVGETGTGKSTLLRSVNGLVPHFSGGTFGGHRDRRRPVDPGPPAARTGRHRRLRRPEPAGKLRHRAVEDELAYTMENLGVPADAMRRRVEDTVDLLGLHDLRDSVAALALGRPTAAGGDRRRSRRHRPRVLVLDEPTSALDPAAAEEVLNALARLVHDLGMTVLHCGTPARARAPLSPTGMVLVPGGRRRSWSVHPRTSCARPPWRHRSSSWAGCVGWDPLPLTVRDARREAVGLAGADRADEPCPRRRSRRRRAGRRGGSLRKARRALRTGRWRSGLVDLELRPGEVTVLMGRNGSGSPRCSQPCRVGANRRGARSASDGATRTG